MTKENKTYIGTSYYITCFITFGKKHKKRRMKGAPVEDTYPDPSGNYPPVPKALIKTLIRERIVTFLFTPETDLALNKDARKDMGV